MKTKTITKMYEYDGVLYTSIREIIEMIINDIVDNREIQEIEYSGLNCDDIEIEGFELAKNTEIVEEE